jgi:hypothetical protein
MIGSEAKPNLSRVRASTPRCAECRFFRGFVGAADVQADSLIRADTGRNRGLVQQGELKCCCEKPCGRSGQYAADTFRRRGYWAVSEHVSAGGCGEGEKLPAHVLAWSEDV